MRPPPRASRRTRACGRCGRSLPVKDIQAHLGIPKSTLSHHIAHLVWAGIVIQTREGRVLRCRIDYDRVHDLLDYLTEDCCAGIHDYLGHDHARAGGRASL